MAFPTYVSISGKTWPVCDVLNTQRFLWIAAVLVAYLTGAPALAQDPKAAARAKADEGLRLYEAKKWQACYDAFSEAEKLYFATNMACP